MIRKAEDVNVIRKECHMGGEGEITIRELLTGPEEMYNRGRVFAHTTLAPGASIGYHVHRGDSEIYYIYSGTAEFNDNGEIRTLHAGDVAVTPEGCGHGIRNTGSGPLDFIAVIVYA